MAKYRDFAPLDPLPADWTDAWQEYLSTGQSNFRLQIKPTDNTVLQVPAGTGNDQVGITIEANPRYIAASIERVSLGGGVARDMDVWVTSTANSFTPGIPGEVDLTNYAFALAITETGVLPGGVAIKRKVGTAHWDGAKFTTVTPTVGFPTAAALGAISAGDAAGGELAGTFPNPTIGALAAGRVLTWGGDTNLYRSALGTLKTDTAFIVGGNLTISGAIVGTPLAPTAVVDTNTAQLATTAFVLGQGATATPLIDGVAAIGTSPRWSRQDHVHPTDTSRAALASPTFTGVPLAPTAAVDTNTTQIATTAFYINQVGTATPAANAPSPGPGLSFRWSRQDHVHPTTYPAFAGSLLNTAQTAGQAVLAQKLLATDANAAFMIFGSGQLSWGAGGAAVVDTSLTRGAASAGSLTVGNSNGASNGVSTAMLSVVQAGNDLEWGHSNPAGFRCTLGSSITSGAPFIALSAEAGTTSGTYRTRGIAGSIITTDVNGTMLLGGVATASADNQAFVKNISLTTTTLGFYGAVAVAQTAAPTQARVGTLPGALTATTTHDQLLAIVSRLANAMQANGFLGTGGAWSS